jgi:hypothetical protein
VFAIHKQATQVQKIFRICPVDKLFFLYFLDTKSQFSWGGYKLLRLCGPKINGSPTSRLQAFVPHYHGVKKRYK